MSTHVRSSISHGTKQGNEIKYKVGETTHDLLMQRLGYSHFAYYRYAFSYFVYSRFASSQILPHSRFAYTCFLCHTIPAFDGVMIKHAMICMVL